MSTMEEVNAFIEQQSQSSESEIDSVSSEIPPICQAWDEVGICDVTTMPENDALVERNAALLESYIVELVKSRETKLTTLYGQSVSNHFRAKSIEKETSTHNPLTSPPATQLPEPAHSELLDFVGTIANMYNNVNYHNFEHATHVTASTHRLLSLIKTAYASSDTSTTQQPNLSNLPRYGVASDPMVHTAMIFSALVHDVEHQGVGNAQLVREGHRQSLIYNDQSVAENNSLGVSFAVLRNERFRNLRECMFGAPSDFRFTSEKKRKTLVNVVQEHECQFRQIVIDVILSTDISSPERQEIGRSKWKHAFENGPKRRHSGHTIQHNKPLSSNNSDETTKTHKIPFRLGIERALTNDGSLVEYHPGGPSGSYSCQDRLRASSALEQIIQAADVAHTMQSWLIFIKWNRKLYSELQAANHAGRGPDCTGNWFQGQITFIDAYVLPLARRLEQCKIFGTMGTIFYENAMINRTRWLREGHALCDEMRHCDQEQQSGGEATTQRGQGKTESDR